MNDALDVLRAAGFPVDQLNAAQRAVLTELGEHEIEALVTVQRRLAEAEDEVSAHDLKLL
jgi:hypothetical protein